MRLKKKTRQHRRDFWATYECDHCGHETAEQSGYDDTNFHQNVIPSWCAPLAARPRPIAHHAPRQTFLRTSPSEPPAMNNTTHDPDRDGTEDPGSTPAEHQRILGREVTAYHQNRRTG